MTYKKILAVLLIFYWMEPVFSQIKLPALIRDSMILQRDTKLKIWGWASKNEKVSINFMGRNHQTTTTEDGKWTVTLSPMKAGGPYTMSITGTNKIILRDVLIGDVWICSGQSNMVHQMELHNIRYSNEIAEANYPQIRHFWIPTVTDLQGPRDNLPAGFWKSAVASDVPRFSAVAYFFARMIYEKYHVPIGLINASVGGTPIEAWTSEDGLKDFPALMQTVQKNKDTAYINGLMRKAFSGNVSRRPEQPKDRGLNGPIAWYDVSYVPKGWRTINIPGYWEDQGIKELNGVVWYRREIDIPASMSVVQARVFLGRIVDADQLYINGKQVGNTTYQYPQRRYNVPEGLLKSGKNVFVIKVTNTAGKGGFVPDKPYVLFTKTDTIDLKGYWQYKVGEVYEPRKMGGSGGISAQNQPTALYNAMIAPLTNYAIKGFLWYQGESNSGRPEQYASLQAELIRDWRNKWKQGEVPFLFVQLPNYMEASYLPSESQWAMLRESQLKSLSMPNTGMAVAIDLGEWNDIHPDNKKDVGERLALLAQKIGYGEKNLVASGPIFQSATVAGNKIIIRFSNTGGGLKANDGEDLREFAIAGEDKRFVWAEAKIEGDSVVVSCKEIVAPLYVRYAWADNPDGAKLYNQEGLPASPFRTDK